MMRARTRQLFTLLVVLAAHGLAGWVLWRSVTQPVVQTQSAPIAVFIIREVEIPQPRNDSPQEPPPKAPRTPRLAATKPPPARTVPALKEPPPQLRAEPEPAVATQSGAPAAPAFEPLRPAIADVPSQSPEAPLTELIASTPRPASAGVVCPGYAATLRAMVYPREALREGVTGEVLVEFAVSEQGKVQDAVIVRTPHRALGRAALAAVRGLQCQGQGHLVSVRLPVQFSLAD